MAYRVFPTSAVHRIINSGSRSELLRLAHQAGMQSPQRRDTDEVRRSMRKWVVG